METKQQDLTKVYNEMIALWMGVKNVWVHPKFGVYEAEDETGYIDWVDVGIRSLDYHRDWNKLMPVVQAIKKIYIEAKDEKTIRKCHNVLELEIDTPIEDVHIAVSNFLKWYTSNQPKSES